MQRNPLFELCKIPDNDGIFIWQYQKNKKRPAYLASNFKSIPNFDSNSCYILILQRHNYKVLQDQPYQSFKIFFWVGAKNKNYEQHFQDTVLLCKDLEQNIRHSMLRLYIEFQYNESFQFFALFKQQESLSMDRVNDICAIKYQDAYRQKVAVRAITFPKILVIELVDYPMEY